jgi:hypothetical protein
VNRFAEFKWQFHSTENTICEEMKALISFPRVVLSDSNLVLETFRTIIGRTIFSKGPLTRCYILVGISHFFSHSVNRKLNEQ